MKANTLLFAVVFSIVVALTASLGYLMFYLVPGQHDVASISVRVLTIAMIDVLYVWFMWSHRGEKTLPHPSR